jgi:aspartyl-tRNA(Asn)/glutamyl-tRNA(Gln) amidotransferase subunit A
MAEGSENTGRTLPTITEAVRWLRSGSIQAVELTRECLQKISVWEPSVQACVTVMEDEAISEATAADLALASGKDRRALLGIPLGIKDLIETRGVRTTAGSQVLADFVPEGDASVVTRLREAGAILLCKTNTHEFAYGVISPPTRNPWNTNHVPGGSSGGSAAAVASGECLGALGTDTGGSIRIPAAACGVTGLKPTFGLLSRAGIIPLSWSLDHAGPIGRSVEDCAVLLDVLAGFDPLDPDSVDVPLLAFSASLSDRLEPDQAILGTRIGVPNRYFFRSLDPEVEQAVRSAIELYSGLGAIVTEVEIPASIEEMFAVYRSIQRPEAYTFHQEQGWTLSKSSLYRPSIYEAIMAGSTYSAMDYIQAQRARRDFATRMRAIFVNVDALLTPTLPEPARSVDRVDEPAVYHGVTEPAGYALRYTFPFNLTGQPALTLPCGFTSANLPIGLQMVATHFGEPTLFRLGHAYQRATEWHKRTPPLPPAHSSPDDDQGLTG